MKLRILTSLFTATIAALAITITLPETTPGTEPKPLPLDPPPVEIQVIAIRYNAGMPTPQRHLDDLSRYMEQHPDEWNAWAEKMRQAGNF